MTRYVLDTNVISNITKSEPSSSLMTWWSKQPDENLYITTLVLAEIRRGILEKPSGRKRQELDTWFTGPEGPSALFAGRILPFNEAAALTWAELMAAGKAEGRPRNALDMMVAAVAIANRCQLVTDNERDFHGLPFINPIRGTR